MKTFKFISMGNALFIRAFVLTIILITGGGNSAWADTVLFSTDFSTADGWTTEDIITSSVTSTTRTIKGTEISFKGYKSSNLSVTAGATSGSLKFTGNNLTASAGSVTDSNPIYYMAIPVTGVVGGVVSVSYPSSSSFTMYYAYDDGNSGTVTAATSAGYGDSKFVITGLTSNKVTIYLGANGKTITGLTISTPDCESASTGFYHFYKKSSSSVTATTLISDADLPTYVTFNKTFINGNSSTNSSTIESPHDFCHLTNLGTDKYYYLNPSMNNKIYIGGLSNVKSIRVYGYRYNSAGNITTTVIKMSGSGSAMTVSNMAFDKETTAITEYTTGDLTELTGYNKDTYYYYILTFGASFNLWGLYIEAAYSCTSVAAPTSLSCSSHSKSSLTFSWTAAENASAYTATLYSDSGCSSQVDQTTGITGSSVTFSGLSGNTTYYCKVQSNGDGETYCAEGNVTDAVSGTTDSKDYTVTVESNNDSYGTASADDSVLDEDETTTITATPETGYKFRSWAVSGTGAELSSTTINPTTLTMGTADATVTATFSALETYTITYNKGANGSGSAIDNGNKTEDTDFTLSSSKYTRAGYLQTGWATTDGGDKAYELGGTYTSNANLDLYPYWVEQHTITYDNNGGMGSMTVTTGAGTVTLKANSFTKSGYSFLGWATTQDKANAGDVEYADKDEYTLDADVTLYAVWAENYCEMSPATSGSNPSAGDVITMQDGAFGGIMTVESSAATLQYTSYGLSSFSGKTTLNVILNDYMKPGTVISLTLYASTAGSRGFDLYTSNGSKITTFSHTSASYATFQYTVTTDDGLDGTNGFQLKKETYIAMIYLKSLAVTDCQPGSVISASGWNTYSSNKRLDLSTISGGRAYVASSTRDGRVQMDRCTDIVEAEEGLLIHGTPGEKFTINATTDEVTYEGTNLLEGVPNGGNAPVGSYVFGWPTADPTSYGFYYVNSSAVALGAGKSYLSTGSGSGARLTLIFDEDETSGISTTVNSQEPTCCFDLQGRKVVSPTKGLYIKNGKKVFVGQKR